MSIWHIDEKVSKNLKYVSIKFAKVHHFQKIWEKKATMEQKMCWSYNLPKEVEYLNENKIEFLFTLGNFG